MDAMATFQAFAKAWNSRDMEKAFSYFAENYVFESVPTGVTAKSRGELRAFLERSLQAFPDLMFETKGAFESGNKAAVEWVMRGTQKSEYNGMPATGKSFAVRGCSIMEFEGDIFTREATYWDQVAVLRQLGHIPSPA